MSHRSHPAICDISIYIYLYIYIYVPGIVQIIQIGDLSAKKELDHEPGMDR